LPRRRHGGGKYEIKERIKVITKHPKTAVCTLVALLLVAALAAGCTFTGTEEEASFSPDTMQMGQLLSSVSYAPITDPETVSRVYSMYENLVIGEETDDADFGWALMISFEDSATGESVSWTLSPEGACRFGENALAEDKPWYEVEGGGALYMEILMIFQSWTGAQTGSADVTLYDCGGLSVAIPNEYIDRLVIISEPEQEAAGWTRLITVYEKQSYEDSRAASDGEVTAGLLFSIVRYTQAQYEQFLRWDNSGRSFFAKDDTYYYGWFIPTDVQFYHADLVSDDINNSDDWKAWEQLNEDCLSIRDDFIVRNSLTAYSDSEFWDQEFTYDGEHLYATYYPYYNHQDIAAAQGFDWRDVTYTLVLSQPAAQGDTGIWCVERYEDENYVYVYFPDADGVSASEYYANKQALCDAGGGDVSALDPEQVALMFVRYYFNNVNATSGSIVVSSEHPDGGGDPAAANAPDGVPEGFDVPDMVLERAEKQAETDFNAYSADYPDYEYVDWRIDTLGKVYVYDDLYGMTLDVYYMSCEFLSDAPENVRLPGGMSMSDDGWVWHDYINYLIFDADSDAFLGTLVEIDASPGTVTFTDDLSEMLADLLFPDSDLGLTPTEGILEQAVKFPYELDFRGYITDFSETSVSVDEVFWDTEGDDYPNGYAIINDDTSVTEYPWRRTASSGSSRTTGSPASGWTLIPFPGSSRRTNTIPFGCSPKTRTARSS